MGRTTPTVSRDHFDAVLFDSGGVLTATAKVHAACWKKAFDNFLKNRAAKTREPFQPFDAQSDYTDYVDSKPRYDGVRSFLASRALTCRRESPKTPLTGRRAQVRSGFTVSKIMPKGAPDGYLILSPEPS